MALAVLCRRQNLGTFNSGSGKGKPIAAVVYLPRMDLLYTAEIGNGAFLNGEKITVSEVCDLMDAKILAKNRCLKKRIGKMDSQTF